MDILILIFIPNNDFQGFSTIFLIFLIKWTVAHLYRKFKGLSVINRTELKLFYTECGPHVIYKKVQRLINNTATAKRYRLICVVRSSVDGTY